MMRWPTAIEWALGAAALVLIGVLLWNFDPFGRRKHAETVAHAAVVQSTVDQSAVKAVDHYTDHVTILHDRAERAADAVQAAAGADTPLPPAVRDAWLGGLRDDPAAAPDPSSAKPAR